MPGRNDLAALRRHWTKLGEVDPLWAVYVDPAKRDGRWDVDDFLATGRDEVAGLMHDLDRLGLEARRGEALDFGCGVGRLTVALSEHYETVTGVDVAPSMLGNAKRLHAANDRCEFVYNDRPDLSIFADDSFDLVYSSLVLQHMSPGLSDGYIREFVRVVRPGGVVALLVPERHLRTPRGLFYAYAPQVIIAWIQRTLFGFPAPMRMHTVPAARIGSLVEPLGGQVADSRPRPWPGHWVMLAHYIRIGTAVTSSPPATCGQEVTGKLHFHLALVR